MSRRSWTGPRWPRCWRETSCAAQRRRRLSQSTVLWHKGITAAKGCRTAKSRTVVVTPTLMQCCSLVQKRSTHTHIAPDMRTPILTCTADRLAACVNADGTAVAECSPGSEGAGRERPGLRIRLLVRALRGCGMSTFMAVLEPLPACSSGNMQEPAAEARMSVGMCMCACIAHALAHRNTCCVHSSRSNRQETTHHLQPTHPVHHVPHAA